MKKRIYVILIFVILFIMLGCGKSYGAWITLNDGDLDLINTIISEDTNAYYSKKDVLKNFNEWFGYEAEEFKSKINIKTTVTIKEPLSGSMWNVKLGNKWIKWMELVKKKYSMDQLRSLFGYEEGIKLFDDKGNTISGLQDGAMWDIAMNVEEVKEPGRYRWKVNVIATGGDIDKINDLDLGNDSASGYADPDDSLLSQAKDKTKEIKDFLSHAKENAITALANWIISLGDGLQELANFAQTWTLGKIELMQTPTEIENAEGTTNDGKGTVKTEAVGTIIPQYDNPFDDPLNINSYLNFKRISEGGSGSTDSSGNTKVSKFIGQADIDGENHNFTENTPIPVIATDIYTLAANKVDSIKTNFFERQEGEERGIFNGVVNFVASIIHGLMYIAAGLIFTATIWHGVGISRASISGNINEQNKHRVALRKLVISLILLFSILFLEAMCLYLSEVILQDTASETGGNKYEGPIRVTVENLYSFSTTPTGYVRYMAGLDNIYLCLKKLAYGVIYLLMALANCILAVGMFVRSFILMFASIMGFWLVLVYIFKSQDASLVPFKQWFMTYFVISLIQVVLAIVARIMLEVIV